MRLIYFSNEVSTINERLDERGVFTSLGCGFLCNCWSHYYCVDLFTEGRWYQSSVILVGGSVGYNRGVKQLFTLRTFSVYSAKQGDLLS